MGLTEEDYLNYVYKIREKKREHRREIEIHKGYHGRKAYYPFKLDEWEKIGKEMPKKQAAELKEMNNKLKELRIKIDERNKKLMEAGREGPQCPICLEDKYAEEGPSVAVSFNKTKCKKHIYHEGCVNDGRLKLCPLCRNDKKKLTRVDKKLLYKLSRLSGNSNSKTKKSSNNSSNKTKRKRCPNGTRKNKINGQCEKKST